MCLLLIYYYCYYYCYYSYYCCFVCFVLFITGDLRPFLEVCSVLDRYILIVYYDIFVYNVYNNRGSDVDMTVYIILPTGD